MESILETDSLKNENFCYLLLPILYKYFRRIEDDFLKACYKEPVNWKIAFMLEGLRTLSKISTMTSNEENNQNGKKLREFLPSWIYYNDPGQLRNPPTLPDDLKEIAKINLK